MHLVLFGIEITLVDNRFCFLVVIVDIIHHFTYCRKMIFASCFRQKSVTHSIYVLLLLLVKCNGKCTPSLWINIFACIIVCVCIMNIYSVHLSIGIGQCDLLTLVQYMYMTFSEILHLLITFYM